jgi:hypothetical protein
MASIHDTMDYGYDPTVAEPGPIFVPPRPATPPPSNATVNAELLPQADNAELLRLGLDLWACNFRHGQGRQLRS